MIDKLRRKFIFICAFSFLTVFSIMILGIYVSNSVRQNKMLDVLADMISENNGRFPSHDKIGRTEEHPLPDFINPETPFTTRFFTVFFDESGIQSADTDFISEISEKEAVNYALSVLNKGKKRGWYKDFRYKVTKDNSCIVFVSGKIHRITAKSFIMSTAGVFGLGSLGVLMMIVIFSKTAVKPVAESYQKQKQFVTDANHELKTPLTLILTNIEIAESELGQNEWLDDIRIEGERMSKLVNQLVNLSRMDEESTAEIFADFNLSQTISETVQDFSDLAQMYGKTITSEISPDIFINGDESQIRQLTAILLDNAVKYCDSNGNIHIELIKKKHSVLRVSNSYQNVDSVSFDRLFDRFYREDTARTAGSGFGVGLSIAQSITLRHKGSIKAFKSQKGQICFQVKF